MSDVVFPDSLWAAVTPPMQPCPSLPADADCDTVVIGAGFTGLSAALELARAGQSVIVLEAKAVGWGASGRNNGQVIPTLTSAEPRAMVARWGAAGERFVRLVGNSASVLFDIARREGIADAAEAEQTGWFQPAHAADRLKLSRARVEAWQSFGFPARLLDREEAAAVLGTDFWHGGMLNPTGGHINPLGLARGLARAARAHGATIYETTPVAGFAHDGTRWIVTSTAGPKVRARALILATNTYTGEIVPRLASRLAHTIVPVLSWQMSTPPIGDNLRSLILPGRQAVSDTRGDLRFFRYDARNRLVTGGAIMGAGDMARRVAAKAARSLAEAFPQLAGVQMTHVWSGYIGMTWDRFPRVHRLGPDGWTWIGCNGRGVALGVSLGRELARAVAGTAMDKLALPVSDPRPLPAHPIARRIAPGYLAWLRRKDLKPLK